jgi:hypothetical protein
MKIRELGSKGWKDMSTSAGLPLVGEIGNGAL